MKNRKFRLILILIALFVTGFTVYECVEAKTLSPKTESVVKSDSDTIARKAVKEDVKIDTVDFKKLTLTETNVRFVMDSIGIHHQNIVIKQAKHETGHFTSKLAVNYGNLFGLRGKNGYYHYSHWSESVIAYKNKIQNRYKEGEDYYSFLRRIKYCSNSSYISLIKKIN